MWTQRHLSRRKTSTEKKLRMKKKTAEKEIPGPWIGASLETTTIGVSCGCKGTRRGWVCGARHPGNSSIFMCSAHRTLCLISPGLRKPLTKTSGDIMRKFPGIPAREGGSIANTTGKFSSASKYGVFPFHSSSPYFKTSWVFHSVIYITPPAKSPNLTCDVAAEHEHLYMYETEQILYSFLSDRFKK